MNMSKEELRKNVFTFRKSLNDKEYQRKNTIIYNKIIKSKWYLEADTIISYVSINNEVDTIELINKAFMDGKKVAVPKIVNEEMNFYYIKSLKELKKGYFNIPEPSDVNDVCIPNNSNMVMIVPGVAFDLNNNRLGYGGGFYDKYLSKYNIHTVAICFKEQLFDKIYTEDYDVKMDEVITD